MLRSLFSGVSGLKNEQAQMDVISNNLANVNTTGFKRSRITFSDALSETLSGARGTAGNFGGANPVQIGRGAVISSVDQDFKQGSLDTTGKVTDVAINGKGFFVVSDGTKNFYSRAGAFQLQADGSLLAHGGTHSVMGRLATDGVLTSTTTLEKIQLPFGRKEPARPTETIDLYCNLDRNASKVEQWLGATALTVDDVPANALTDLASIDGNEIYTGDVIAISGKDSDGNEVNGTFTYGIDGKTVQAFINKINEIYSSDLVEGGTATIDENGRIRLTANQAGENQMTIFVTSPSSNHQPTTETHTFADGDEYIATEAAVATSDINDFSQSNGAYVDGTDTIDITIGADTVTFAYGAAADGLTYGDLSTFISTNFDGVATAINATATIESDGNLAVVDNATGDRITVTLANNAGAGTGMDGNTRFTIDDGAATISTQILDVKGLSGYAIGGSINLSGTTPDGTPVTAEFVIEDGTETIQDLLDLINDTFLGVNASLDEDGKIIVEDNSAGFSQTYVSIEDGSGTGFARTFVHEIFTASTKLATDTVAAGVRASSDDKINNLEQVNTPYAANDVIEIQINGQTHDFHFHDGNETVQDFLTFINSNFGGTYGVTATLDSSGNIVLTNNIDASNNTTLSMTDATGNSGTGIGGSSALTIETATLTTALNDIKSVTTASSYVDGDTLIMTATKSDGTTLSTTFTYGPTTSGYDGTTLGDLLDTINSTFSGSGLVASVTDGVIEFTDNDATDGINFTSVIIADGLNNNGSGLGMTTTTTAGTNVSEIKLPSFSNLEQGETGTHSTSIKVYDSMGESHVVEIEFTQDPQKVNNRWTWNINIDNGLIDPIAGDVGTVEFNEDGSLKSFNYTNGNALRFAVEGADEMEIDISPGTAGGFDGITQMASASTTIAIEQDGYTLGILNDINIDDQGIITGIYSNGVNKTLAQVALANFTNEAGLLKEGNSMYSSNSSTGNPIITWAGQNTKTVLKSGFLESSNVDLTDEFAKMIISQRALTANAKVVSTSDQILTTIIDRMKR